MAGDLAEVQRALVARSYGERGSLIDALASLPGNRAGLGVYAAHRRTCAACRRFSQGLARENEALRAALAVEVPPGLADRVLLSRRTSGARWAGLALAAGVSSAQRSGRFGRPASRDDLLIA